MRPSTRTRKINSEKRLKTSGCLSFLVLKSQKCIIYYYLSVIVTWDLHWCVKLTRFDFVSFGAPYCDLTGLFKRRQRLYLDFQKGSVFLSWFSQPWRPLKGQEQFKWKLDCWCTWKKKVTPENNNKHPSLTEGMFLEFGLSTHLSNCQ